jgi:hypothetical protein
MRNIRQNGRAPTTGQGLAQRREYQQRQSERDRTTEAGCDLSEGQEIQARRPTRASVAIAATSMPVRAALNQSIGV